MSEEVTLSFNCSIPALLTDKIDISDPYKNYNARGNPTSFGVDLDFDEMNLSKTLKSIEFYVLRGKIEDTLRRWEEKYQRYLHKLYRSNHIDELNKEAKEAIATLNNILTHTLSIDDTVDWDTIKRKDSFRVKPSELFSDGKEPTFIKFNAYGRPTELEKISSPVGPIFAKTANKYGFFSKVFRGKAIKEDFEDRVGEWEQQKKRTNKDNTDRELLFNQAVSIFDGKKKEFEEGKQRDNEALEKFKLRYKEKDSKAIEEYCDLVLNNSQYPDYFPQNWVLECREDSRIAVVEYDLPAPVNFLR